MQLQRRDDLTSDFSAARLHLERAHHYVRGDDNASREICFALELLIEAVVTAEYTRPRGEVVQFRQMYEKPHR